MSYFFLVGLLLFLSAMCHGEASPLMKSVESNMELASSVEEAKVAPTERADPLERNRREVGCPFPQDLPQLVQTLNTYLNASQYVGLLMQDAGLPPLPTQPITDVCPPSWWPGQELNLRSTCPWILEDFDLGDGYYPRYVRQTKCVCPMCVNANAYRCESIYTSITVFERGPCKNGLAVMTAVKRVITAGCFCATNAQQIGDNSYPVIE